MAALAPLDPAGHARPRAARRSRRRRTRRRAATGRDDPADLQRAAWVPQLSAHTGNGIERLPRSVSRVRLPSAEAPSDGVGPVLPCGPGRRGLASGDVFVRASIRQNSAGVPVRYLQLVHNVWDPVSRTSKAKVLHSFGREDELDRAAIERLIASLRRLLGPAGALSPPDPSDGAPEGLAFVAAKALGATWALDGIWPSLGLDGLLRRLLANTRRDDRVERVLFALVAAGAIAPASKLATAAWLTRRTHIPGLTDIPPDEAGEPPGVGEDECYRAMDWLIGAAPQVEREVFWSLASLLELEVDLLFFDTTSSYFEIDDADAPVPRDERGHPQPTDG